MSTPQLPAHIGGYQHLEPDVIVEAADIIVHAGIVKRFVHEHDLLGGAMTVGEAEAITGARIYRKIPVPKPDHLT